MTQPSDATPGPQANQPSQPSQPRGRYRFQGGQSLDPDAGVHPEMASGQDNAPVGAGIPNSPHDLIAMQTNKPERPEKPERQHSPKVKQVLELLKTLETSAAEDQQIALVLVRRLENFHDEVVGEMKDDEEAKHSQIVSWAIDADRLFRARVLLESVDLE
jgi:hypothetical protein